jgi:hypothetical protein
MNIDLVAQVAKTILRLLCERLNSCRPLIDFIASGPFDGKGILHDAK